MAAITVNVSLPGDLKARMDRARGDVAVSRWVMRAIEQRLAREEADAEEQDDA